MIDINYDITKLYAFLEGLSTFTLTRIDKQLQADYWRAINARGAASEEIDDLNRVPFDQRAADCKDTINRLEDRRVEANNLSLMISRVRNRIMLIGRERATGAQPVPVPDEITPKNFWLSLSDRTVARIALALIDEGKPRPNEGANHAEIGKWFNALELVARVGTERGWQLPGGKLINWGYVMTTYDRAWLQEVAEWGQARLDFDEVTK